MAGYATTVTEADLENMRHAAAFDRFAHPNDVILVVDEVRAARGKIAAMAELVRAAAAALQYCHEPRRCGHGHEWRAASALYGPAEDGWCLADGDDYGATTYVNISHCPWCGARLPLERPGPEPAGGG